MLAALKNFDAHFRGAIFDKSAISTIFILSKPSEKVLLMMTSAKMNWLIFNLQQNFVPSSPWSVVTFQCFVSH